MLFKKVCQIPNLAIDNKPAVGGGVVLRNLLDGEQSSLAHFENAVKLDFQNRSRLNRCSALGF